MFWSWSRRLDNLDLKGKITLALVTGSLLVGGLVALPSFIFARHLLIEGATSSLIAEARRERLSIELRLASDMALAESLANNTISANALADSLGREQYLIPLLRNQKLQFQDANLELIDFQGKPVASSFRPGGIPAGGVQAFKRLMETGEAQALVVSEASSERRLVALFPVVYRLTGNVEGAIILSIPMTSLLEGYSGRAPDSLLSVEGQLLAGRQPAELALHSTAVLKLPSPLTELGLSHTHCSPRDEALRKLNIMAVVVGGVGLAMIGLVVIFSRRAATWLAKPLGHLVQAAEMAAATGRPQRLQEWRGKDELARVNQAFNRMADRLTRMYDDLEEQVESRTQALASSEKRLRYVMDATGEGIWDWDIANDRVFHNGRWCELLGLDRKLRTRDFQAFAAMLHPEDKQDVQDAVEASMYQDRAYFHEHRMVRPDGRVIWVLDRGKVVEFDDAGKPSRMVGSLMDVTERLQATEALRDRELYLRATLDNLPFLFWLKDTESRFLTVNAEFARACGQTSAGAVVGLTDMDVWPRDLAELYRADDMAVMASCKEKAVEEPVEIEGQRRWIETYKKPVVTPDGTVLGTVGFARDITGRKLTEEALERSEQRWQLAVSGTNDGIWDVDFQAGSVFYSDRWKGMLGYGPDEIGHEHEEWVSRIHPDDRERVLEEGQRHMDGRSDYYQTEFRMRCKDGGYKWILSRGRALFDAEGKCIRMSGSHTDITDRRAAEAALLERTEQLDAIFCLSPDGFVSFDSGRTVRFLNPAFLRMTGFQAENLVGLEEDVFVSQLNTILRADLSLPSITRLRSEARRKADGASEPHFIELNRTPRTILQVVLELSQSQTVPQILYLRDVTREKEVEQIKSEFLSTAAHELRTPMASILGFSELLLHKDFDVNTRQDLLRTIHEQSELMASILNELLDLARIEARQGKDFILERLDLRELTEAAVRRFGVPRGRTSPLLDIPDTGLPVEVDRKKIQQVITNVLSNAYKYSSGDGVVRVELIPQRMVDEQFMVGFGVTDQGIGMDATQVSRVCERFYRADTSGAIPGTGLGMSIVKEIVDLHHGRLIIESVRGQGTVVSVMLPLTHPSTAVLVPAGLATGVPGQGEARLDPSEGGQHLL